MQFKKAHTIYDQIADHICENILRGRWPAGQRVPSVRELAVQIEVNPNTVMRAYTNLQEASVIVNQRGKGYFVGEDSRERVLEIKRKEFLDEELPELAKKLKLLHITPTQLTQMLQSADMAGRES